MSPKLLLVLKQRCHNFGCHFLFSVNEYPNVADNLTQLAVVYVYTTAMCAFRSRKNALMTKYQFGRYFLFPASTKIRFLQCPFVYYFSIPFEKNGYSLCSK